MIFFVFEHFPFLTFGLHKTQERYRDINHHVIAARITAENPDEGFKPTSGLIERVKFQSTPNVWGYFSVGTNGGIHEFADSQFGHLFASGPNRYCAKARNSTKCIQMRSRLALCVKNAFPCIHGSCHALFSFPHVHGSCHALCSFSARSKHSCLFQLPYFPQSMHVTVPHFYSCPIIHGFCF
jgi:hypothetical protein